MNTPSETFRVLVAEDEDAIVEDYLVALADRPQDGTEGEAEEVLADLESDLFGEAPEETTPTGSDARFDVAAFSQGEHALEAHATAQGSPSQKFDIALIDVRMPPGIDGVETARRLRQRDEDILIGIVTGQADLDFDQIADLVLPPEKIFFVRKPFLCDEMRATVMDEVTRIGRLKQAERVDG